MKQHLVSTTVISLLLLCFVSPLQAGYVEQVLEIPHQLNLPEQVRDFFAIELRREDQQASGIKPENVKQYAHALFHDGEQEGEYGACLRSLTAEEWSEGLISYALVIRMSDWLREHNVLEVIITRVIHDSSFEAKPLRYLSAEEFERFMEDIMWRYDIDKLHHTIESKSARFFALADEHDVNLGKAAREFFKELSDDQKIYFVRRYGSQEGLDELQSIFDTKAWPYLVHSRAEMACFECLKHHSKAYCVIQDAECVYEETRQFVDAAKLVL